MLDIPSPTTSNDSQPDNNEKSINASESSLDTTSLTEQKELNLYNDPNRTMLNTYSTNLNNGTETPTTFINKNENTVTWSASQFIAHEKSSTWYGAFILFTIVFTALVWWMTKDITSCIVVIISALVFVYYASRKPQLNYYILDPSGITINKHFYNFQNFQAFSLVQEGAFTSINLLPLKRFSPLMTIYYDPNDEKKIIELLSKYLPIEPAREDMIEKLMHLIRF